MQQPRVIQIHNGKFSEAVPLMEQTVQLPGADSFHWGNLARVPLGRQRGQVQTSLRAGYESAPGWPQPARREIRSNLLRCYRNRSPGRSTGEIIATPSASKDVSVFRFALVNELACDRVTALRDLEDALRGGYSAIDSRLHPDLSGLRLDPRYVGSMASAPKPAVQ